MNQWVIHIFSYDSHSSSVRKVNKHLLFKTQKKVSFSKHKKEQTGVLLSVLKYHRSVTYVLHKLRAYEILLLMHNCFSAKLAFISKQMILDTLKNVQGRTDKVTNKQTNNKIKLSSSKIMLKSCITFERKCGF